jgi:hypothetical protein
VIRRVGLLALGVIALAAVAAVSAATFLGTPAGRTATALTVLDGRALQRAIEDLRSGRPAPADVVTSVGVDLSRRTAPLERECVPVGDCRVVGTLDGLEPGIGTVTVRAEEYVVPPPTDPADLAGPLALRLSATGPIELLGRLPPQPRILSVPELAPLTASAPAGQVVAVDGWLETIEGGFSCGPSPNEPPPIPEPFRCHVTPFLSADPVKPVTPEGSNGRSAARPPGAVPVQEGAYERFASNPASDGTNAEPRHGVYLVRKVVDEAPNCPDCRGWLVVGRFDPPATAWTSTLR